jgi:hypothetical protein
MTVLENSYRATMTKTVHHLKDISAAIDGINGYGRKATLKFDTDKASSSLVIQMPKMIAPFGISRYDNKGQARFTLDLRIEESDQVDIRQCWEDMEARFKRIARANAVELFGRAVSDDFVDAMFTSAIKESKSGDFPPTLRCVIPSKDGVLECAFIGENGKPFNEACMNRGACVQVILELTRIWTMDKQFGCTPIVRAVKVCENETRQKDSYMFLD